MDLCVVLHGEQQSIERRVSGVLRECGQGLLRGAHVSASHGFAQDLAAGATFG